MSNDEVRKFAIDKGYKDIKEVGDYNGYKVYIPMFKGSKKFVGYPQYILVKDSEILLKQDISMEITKAFYS